MTTRPALKPGFTLIELLVYLGMSTIVVLVISNFMIDISQSAARTRAAISLQANSRLVINRITQAGSGGIILDNTSKIYGDIYSNGSIIPNGGGDAGSVYPCPNTPQNPTCASDFPGNVWVAGSGNSLQRVDMSNGNDTHSDMIEKTTVKGHAYYWNKVPASTGNTVKANGGNETCNNVASAANPPFCLWKTESIPTTRPLPITDMVGDEDLPTPVTHVGKWVKDINTANQIVPTSPLNCPNGYNDGSYYCVPSSGVTFGNQKITGNLYVGNGDTLTLSGNIYVTGKVIIDTNATVQVTQDVNLQATWVIIAQDIMSADNGALLRGSGNQQSFLILLSRSTNQDTDNTCDTAAICASNNSTSILFAAPQGMVRVKNLGHLRATVANVIMLFNNSDITFNPNISNLTVPGSGNGFTGVIGGSWQEK